MHAQQRSSPGETMSEQDSRTSKECDGPPFTVTRYGSLGASICAERNWLRAKLDEIKEICEDERASVRYRELCNTILEVIGND